MRPRPASTGERYGRVAIGFHWTIAALVILNLALGILHEQVGRPLSREMITVHKSVGVTVLVLTLLRLAWRLGHRAPRLPEDVPGWDRGLAHASQWLMYIGMVALPVTGWWMAAGPTPHPFQWFGLFTMPAFPLTEGADGAHSAHVVMGWTMLALVLLHVAGALRHQVLLHDRVLDRMWPGMAPR